MTVNIDLSGKNAVVFGIATETSIAWHIAKKLNEAGCRIAAGYQERAEPYALPLIQQLNNPVHGHCDVVDEDSVDRFLAKVENEMGPVDYVIHSIAFAKKDDLKGRYIDVDLRGFQVALQVSAYSLPMILRKVKMNKNGSVLAMTYYGAEKVMPGYNVMGIAKASLEASVKYAASDLGSKGIRVNAISAGPIKTMAASGIADFKKMLKNQNHKSPMSRSVSQEEVANTALFLCSELSTGITGQIIFVDAGYSTMGT